MDNQKNGQNGNVIHQEAVNANFCPVRLTAARVSAILVHGMPLTTPISFVQPGIHVQPPHILHTVQRGAKLAKLTDSGGIPFPELARIRCAPRAPWPYGYLDMAQRQL